MAEKAVKCHPELAFFLGFMRRYDPSYAYAKKKIEEGAIGTPYIVKATGIDPKQLVEGAIKFAATSGGIFIDCVQKGIKPEVTVYDGTKSTQIGFATIESYKKGEIIKIEY